MAVFYSKASNSHRLWKYQIAFSGWIWNRGSTKQINNVYLNSGALWLTVKVFTATPTKSLVSSKRKPNKSLGGRATPSVFFFPMIRPWANLCFDINIKDIPLAYPVNAKTKNEPWTKERKKSADYARPLRDFSSCASLRDRGGCGAKISAAMRAELVRSSLSWHFFLSISLFFPVKDLILHNTTEGVRKVSCTEYAILISCSKLRKKIHHWQWARAHLIRQWGYCTGTCFVY